jgi:hypothetical protein
MNKTHLLDIAKFQRGYLSMLVDDIPDDRFAEQPAGVRNHPAWQVGHLAWAFDGIGAAFMGKSPVVDPSWKDRFGQGSVPTNRRADYPSKAELVRTYDERRHALAHAFEGASLEHLAKPNPVEGLSKLGLNTLGHLALFGLVTHEATHLGQLASWRSATGMVPALSKLGG